MEKERIHYLEQLAELYPTIGRASTEIINLQSILYLPKGTEHFCRTFTESSAPFPMYFAMGQEQYERR